MSNADPRCKCTMSQSLVGDGCRYCQPQEYIDRLEEQVFERTVEAAVEICNQESSEWDSDHVQTYKDYAEYCGKRISNLKLSEI